MAKINQQISPVNSARNVRAKQYTFKGQREQHEYAFMLHLLDLFTKNVSNSFSTNYRYIDIVSAIA